MTPRALDGSARAGVDASMDYPPRREHPLHPPRSVTVLHQAQPPIARARLWDGSTVWLVAGHEQARYLLGDHRLTAVTSSPGFPMMTRTSTLLRNEPKSASFIRMDNPEHGRLRSMLSREFLPRPIETHRPAVRQTLEEALRLATAGRGRPLDLVETIATPVPARIIAGLLAIPERDLDFFVDLSAVLIDRSFSPEDVRAAREDLDSYLANLARFRMNTPEDDLVSRLMTTYVKTGQLSFEDAVPMIRLILVAGHGTTTSQLSLTLLTLATEPDLRDLCLHNDDLIPSLIDELLRYHTIVQNGVARAALEDICVGDHTIRAGEGVVISLSAANRDPHVFGDPDRIDIDRDARRHLAFGHGIHQCLGQWLAKLELEEAVRTVLAHMPQLELACSPADLEFRHEVSSYGLNSLPVTW